MGNTRDQPPEAAKSVAPAEAEAGLDELTRSELLEHALALRTVVRVADAVHRASDFADLAERAVDAIIQYTRYPSVALFRIDYERERAELIASRGFSPEILKVGSSLPLLGSLTGTTVRSRAVTTATDIGHDDRIEPNTRQALDAEGFVDVACVPIFFREDVIGCLNLIYKRDAQLTPHERSTLLALGKTIGIAMQNRLAAQERRALEQRLSRAQHLERLGVLAGGIAHDFNNLLTGILSHITLAQRALATPENALRFLHAAEKAALRSAALAQQMLALSHGGAPLKCSNSDVATVVRDAAQFAARGHAVRCELDVSGEIGALLVDAAQLGQVVQNLVLNAIQASPAGAVVRVQLEYREQPDGGLLQLTVSDAGEGIAPELLERVFDPYFTTRPQGSGLGLATTNAIVERHAGSIHVDSERGRGTSFRVELPITRAAAPPVVERDVRLPLGARILIVDDDERVRHAASNVLRHLGIVVTAAASSEEGLACFERALRTREPFAGVILDLTMAGGEDGIVTLARMRGLDPSIRALVSSGYSDGAESVDFAKHGFVGSLPKPYTFGQLSQALAVLLCVSSATQ